jgi:transcriptional regulator with XRE-family HTH domain
VKYHVKQERVGDFMSFQATIRELREKVGASQQDVADAIGIARATYASLEADRRPPNLDEMQALAEYYQIAPSELIDGAASMVNEPVAPYNFEETTEEIIPRDLDPKTNPEKLREVLLYVLEKVGAKPNVGETVLYKLLYFIDFDYYEKTGHSVTGLNYVRNHFGPTPVARDFRAVIEGMKKNEELEIAETEYFRNTQKKYLPRKSVKLEKLSASELQHIDETLARLSDKTANELTELSHYDTPWLAAKQGEKINYRGVFYRTSLTAVTEPSDEL